MKRFLMLLLVVLLALGTTLSALAAAEPSPNAGLVNTDPNSIKVANELVEFSVLARGKPPVNERGTYWWVDFVEKEMNIKLNIEFIDAGVFREKLTILAQTDSLPDMIMASATIWSADVMTWGMEDQLFLAIDKYREYAPRYFAEIEKQPELVAATTTPDGHTYGFSNIRVVNEGQSMGIFTITNTEWLDRLGMEMPTTLDEFYNMLVAFRDEDANGDGDPTNEIPWQGANSGGYPERIFVNWAFGINGYRWDAVDSYTYEGYFSPYHPRYKESIAFMKKCWDEGLFQSTFFSGTGEENFAYGQANTDYTYYGFSVDLDRTQMTGNKDLWSSYSAQIPVIADDSVVRSTWKGLPIDLFTWTINASTKYPEVAVAFLDSFYDPYLSILYTHGPEFGSEYDYYGTGWEYDPETQSMTYPNNTYANKGDYNYVQEQNTIMDGATFGLEGSTAAKYYFDDWKYGLGWSEEEARWQKTLAENNYPYEMPQYLSTVFYTDEEKEIYDTYRAPLQNYMMAQEALFISGERDWDEFDDYMKELDDMGGQVFNELLKTKLAAHLEMLGIKSPAQLEAEGKAE